jgi:hypothetical protein
MRLLYIMDKKDKSDVCCYMNSVVSNFLCNVNVNTGVPVKQKYYSVDETKSCVLPLTTSIGILLAKL